MLRNLVPLWVSLFLMFVPCVAVAQSDSVAVDDNIPAFDSTAIAIPEDGMDEYYAPDSMGVGKRNPIYYFGHNFSTIFVEVSSLIGYSDVALGLNAAYVPEVWGGYMSGHVGVRYRWFSAGPEYRFSSPWDHIDWHGYAGLAVGRGVGGEIGLRVATNADVNRGKFATISGSVGLRATNGGIFLTGGLSVSLAAAATVLWIVL